VRGTFNRVAIKDVVSLLDTDWLFDVEGGAGENTTVEDDKDPRTPLQEPQGQPPFHKGGNQVPHLSVVATAHNIGGC